MKQKKQGWPPSPSIRGFHLRSYAAAWAVALLRRLRSSPIQQLIGQAISHDSQYQCGHPLFQFGMVATSPITSPRTNSHSTPRAALVGAKRAHSQAQKMEIAMNSAVLAMSALFDGMRPLTKSPGN